MKELENSLLLKKLAWSFSTSTGVEFDDLFQEAYIAYHEAMKSFDPKKAKLSTYVWKCVSSHLKNYVKLEKPYLEMESIETPEVINKPGLSVSNFFDALSFEAQQIVKIVSGSSRVFYHNDKEKVIKKITQTLVRRGWDERKIEVGLHDLQVALQ